MCSSVIFVALVSEQLSGSRAPPSTFARCAVRVGAQRRAERGVAVRADHGRLVHLRIPPRAQVYFRFILVPLTMAYFLTFLLGPVIDLLAQRPLICVGQVCCKIAKLSPVWQPVARRLLPQSDLTRSCMLYASPPPSACMHVLE
jgi:hypothetical protein